MTGGQGYLGHEHQVCSPCPPSDHVSYETGGLASSGVSLGVCLSGALKQQTVPTSIFNFLFASVCSFCRRQYDATVYHSSFTQWIPTKGFYSEYKNQILVQTEISHSRCVLLSLICNVHKMVIYTFRLEE